ncbi:MAG: trypsin-like peptidase domain-containing protein [Acidobacteria bacterium]|nr:trypsin-like peptidase domain-containing protein [Acidobacteriota bacterium]
MIATFTHLTGSRRGLCEKFQEEVISIGRAADNALCFGAHERRVSSHHAQINRHGDTFLLRDLGSTNGTMINGRRVIISELNADDLIEVGAGGPLLRFGLEQAVEVPQTAATSPSANAHTASGNSPFAAPPASLTLLLKNFLKQRKTNVRLTSAILISMIFGAGFGIWLSVNINPADRFRTVAERNSAAVVFIQTEYELVDSNGKVVAIESRTGTGFIINDQGLIVTNRHVIRDWEYNPPPAGLNGRSKSISVVLEGHKREEAIAANVAQLSSDKNLDVVILRIAPPPDVPTIYGVETNVERLRQGDEVATIGYPLGISLLPDSRLMTSFTTGVISRIGADVIQLDLHAYHGNSGSPVLNRQGAVIGIVTANATDAPEIIFCTPIGVVEEMISSHSSLVLSP